jgi:hypothetical protein
MSFNKRFVNCTGDDLVEGKIHTIRAHYNFWKKFTGKEFELFYWEGKPYRSRQKVFCVKTIKSVRPSCFDGKNFWLGSLEGSGNINPELLARNEGFKNVAEFYEWFEDYERPLIMGVVHFTDFLYVVENTDSLANLKIL